MKDDKDVQKIIDEIDIVELISEYVVLKKSGANYKGFSPFKEERTPSFTVSPAKKIFKDFSTGIGGNVITFYMRMNNVNFIEAKEELAKKYDIKIQHYQPLKQDENNVNNKYYKILSTLNKFYIQNLLSNEIALNYIYNRGFTLEDIKKYNIGYSTNSWNDTYNYLIDEGYAEDELVILGIVKQNDSGNIFDFFRNRIMFPIQNQNAKIIGFGGRIIESNENAPKYLNSLDSPVFNKGKELFGLINGGEIVRRKDYAILMEGYLDVLTSHKNGFDNAVASLGTALTEDQVILLKKYTNNIVISYDNDEAGKNATLKASYLFKKYDFNVKCLVLSGNEKDPDEYIRKNGKKEFIKELKKAEDVFDYTYNIFTHNLDLEDIVAKKELIFRFKDFFSNLTNKIEIDSYVDKIAVELKIQKETVIDELIKMNVYNKNKKIRKEKKIETIVSKSKLINKYDMLEESTIKLILRDKSYFKNFENKKFDNIIYSDILDKLKEINFDIYKVKDEQFENEEEQIIFNLSSRGLLEISNLEVYFKDIFVGWFKREIKEYKEENNKDKYFLIRFIEDQLKNIHNIEEIEELYKKFKEI